MKWNLISTGRHTKEKHVNINTEVENVSQAHTGPIQACDNIRGKQ